MVQSDINQRFLDYWRSIRGAGGSIPARADFDPVSVPRGVLDHLFLTQISPDPFRVRILLQGSFITTEGGQSLRGKDVGPDTFGAGWEEILGLYRRVAMQGRPIRSKERHTGAHGWKILTEVILAPLSDDEGAIGYVVGSLDRLKDRTERGAPGRTDTWSVLDVADVD
ncbi:PAS domain-containing protein [Rhodospirillaceae bacterium KN72]|uniref:PAS domain-containing protein n=1 Tax=Pacificispira spongiicola TaxID=2729598 RepID=A0A7Y0HCW8_9PROT|nr:PAS domain-containing protein [Pacificispira spongiicola]NMM43161.1 PAS domain-containing protein [Pacificispira spongiicola]